MPNLLRPRTLLTLFLFLPGAFALGQALPNAEGDSDCPAIDPPAVASRFAFIDPATGRLRQPTLEEAAAAAAFERAVRLEALSALEVVVHPDGMKEIDLKDAFLTNIVASRNPDGSLSIRCLPIGARLPSLSATPQPSALEEK